MGSWGRTDTILAVVRKPPESMQMPLSLFLRMSIITSAVMLPAEDEVGTAQQTGVRETPAGVPCPRAHHSQTLMPLQHLTPCPEAGLGSLHAHRLLGQGEDLRKVKDALSSPPTLSLGMAAELWVSC